MQSEMLLWHFGRIVVLLQSLLHGGLGLRFSEARDLGEISKGRPKLWRLVEKWAIFHRYFAISETVQDRDLVTVEADRK